ncbi:MAG TPA: tRNA (adenosine(37)-N6)-threonylcarbamoyltransferase complex transferase subunit TsaD [Candidatus Cloacimonadota bacterium]|nr:tRNA (adenosine(37)-N6)-threonylcarbamoyltransferase complex transferase subunit TsaD [Candidatus Cloacimonadota bacterium]HOQ79982.1 tRNA (adenosine(37)-N6)-threonylcarbamoyltransferase complex transferase subunit TsaD [Candidatus Cloacimonadota bacterium]HPK41383.1 tRNA (adenosine(37)-N6)-threonylcarbamoyltransferase complex transferase subunit TsaD [Candidatus Cloacimonadota bacterium]HPY95906.1 tRNA (adenosine(37)-N6)-threonylcarbamoyltransferase complex transferase subunit TsaD [Candidat
MKNEYILAIESSCDDTSIAIIDTNYKLYANIISSQLAHNDFGGVVPELASRLHLKNISYCMDMALQESQINLEEISAIAVSINPGLIGSLLVGTSFAKGLAWSLGVPLISVNHMLGHVFANKIANPDLQAPWLALVISGGHTELVEFESESKFQIVGNTVDDAAGEAFDKIAKILNLGYPGGPVIDKLAKEGDPNFHKFPQAMNIKDNYNFSFSGLKTSVLQYIGKQSDEFIQLHLNDIVASAQHAIVSILVKKTIAYATKNNIKKIIVAGGVSANSYLREQMQAANKKLKADIYFPPIKLCMDNAAMIGAAAIRKYLNKEFAKLDLNAFSTKGIKEV